MLMISQRTCVLHDIYLALCYTEGEQVPIDWNKVPKYPLEEVESRHFVFQYNGRWIIRLERSMYDNDLYVSPVYL